MYYKKTELVEKSSNCSEHGFHFRSQMDRDFHSLMILQVMRKKKKKLKCDINGLQEALVFKE